MRWLEVRRHSYTRKGGGGSSLSADGVRLARAVGDAIGPVAYVVTSTVPRTLETAVAMGFAVDETLGFPGGYVAGEVGHHDQWSWPRPFVTYAHHVARGRGLAQVAAWHRDLWHRTVERVPDGRVALVVGHGGAIEPALVACLPAADHVAWGPPFSHCDGARLAYDGGRFVAVHFHRTGRPAP